VPRHWAIDYPPWATALLFGIGLGSGCYTRIVVPTFYFLFLFPFILFDGVWPLAIWGCYGLARTLHVWWVAGTLPGDDAGRYAQQSVFALCSHWRWMSRANAVVLALTASGLAYLVVK
jgi:hypothetical protein